MKEIGEGAQRKHKEIPRNGRVHTRHSRGKRTSSGPASHSRVNELSAIPHISPFVLESFGDRVIVDGVLRGVGNIL